MSCQAIPFLEITVAEQNGKREVGVGVCSLHKGKSFIGVDRVLLMCDPKIGFFKDMDGCCLGTSIG